MFKKRKPILKKRLHEEATEEVDCDDAVLTFELSRKRGVKLVESSKEVQTGEKGSQKL